MDLVHSELTCVFYFILNKSTKYSNFFLLFLSIFFLIFSFPQNFYTRKLDGIKVFFAGFLLHIVKVITLEQISMHKLTTSSNSYWDLFLNFKYLVTNLTTCSYSNDFFAHVLYLKHWIFKYIRIKRAILPVFLKKKPVAVTTNMVWQL